MHRARNSAQHEGLEADRDQIPQWAAATGKTVGVHASDIRWLSWRMRSSRFVAAEMLPRDTAKGQHARSTVASSATPAAARRNRLTARDCRVASSSITRRETSCVVSAAPRLDSFTPIVWQADCTRAVDLLASGCCQLPRLRKQMRLHVLLVVLWHLPGPALTLAAYDILDSIKQHDTRVETRASATTQTQAPLCRAWL